MKPTIFNSLSHADFLRLTLEAFARQGFEVERSKDAGADAVLVSKGGKRIAVLCKKYRDAFIGRPVLQQLHAAMGQMVCKEGYLITTTDCAPDAHEFAKGKGLELYNRDRTTRLFKSAFGDEFMRTGKMPELGHKAKAVPAPVKKPVSLANYEKVPVSEKKTERVPEQPIAPMPAPEPVPVLMPEPGQPVEPIKAPELETTPALGAAPELPKATELEMPSGPLEAADLEQEAGPVQTSGPSMAPPEGTAKEEQPEEVESVEDLGAPEPAEAPSEKNMRTIFCAECNQPTQVPTDQGMIKVQCSECGSRWLFQPEMTEDGQVKTTTVIACQTCSQKLNVPVDRGQLNVKCPKCGEKWLFSP